MPNHFSAPSRRDILGSAVACTATALLPGRALAAVDAVSVARAVNTIELTTSMMTTAQVEMRRRGASPRERTLEMAQLRQGDTDLSLRRYTFLSPADIDGTKLLIHETDGDANDLWLLLPSVGRPRRISASKLSNPFAGTDFSYADLMAIKVENFDHQITSSTADTVVLESQAKTTAFAKEIGYARSVVTALAGSFIPTEIAYFDRKGRQFKVQRLGDAVTAPNGSHVLRSRVMTVLDTGHETELQLGAVDFSSGLTTSDFSSRRL